MNIVKISLVSILILSGCNSSDQQAKQGSNAEQKAVKITMTIKGSDTVLPLTQKEAEVYMQKNSNASITVVGGGSGVGISALLEGTTDIGMSSRPLKMDEKLKFSGKKIDLAEVIIASDALAVIVNNKNKVERLTHEQITDIFTGKITNWKQVGGKDGKIVCYSRETSSGTYEFFKEHVMDKKNYATSVLNMPATGAIIQSVSQTEGAIGYVGLAYETKDVKPLAVSYDQGVNYVLPSIEHAQDGTYPISRPLYYFYDKGKSEKVKSFVDFILSEEGQLLVKEVGYVPLKK